MNTIRHNRIGVIENSDGTIDITVPKDMAEEFKQMVKQGTNCYPNKNVEIADFADRLLGRESYSGTCMKQEIYGYPPYLKPQAEVIKVDIVGEHWDIPAEDKHDIATFNEQYMADPSKKD